LRNQIQKAKISDHCEFEIRSGKLMANLETCSKNQAAKTTVYHGEGYLKPKIVRQNLVRLAK
jgi:hypothetical protein